MNRTTKTGLALVAAATTVLGANAFALADGIAPAPSIDASAKGLNYTVKVDGCPTNTTSIRVEVARANSDEKPTVRTIKGGPDGYVFGERPSSGRAIALATCMDGDTAISKKATQEFDVTEDGASEAAPDKPSLPKTGA